LERRTFMASVSGGLLATPLAAQAQPAGKVWRVGYLGNSTPTMESSLVEGFRTGLREHGYREGQNIAVEYRWAEGSVERMPGLAAELVRLKVDVIVTSGTPASLAVKRATTTIPIVVAAVGDAVGVGLVPSLARPGGNVTGVSTLYPDLEGKRLQLLKEIVPGIKRAAVLMNPANPFTPLPWREARAAAGKLHIALQPAEVVAASDFERVFAMIAKGKPDALFVLADRPFLISHRAEIVRFAAERRLPAMYPFREFVEDGGLVVYSPDFVELFRRAASYVDKVLKGAKPADLPIEQPTKFELVINLKTAKALGLTIPPSLLGRADAVIR
jgi:putative ABC transport system substrate-binding protein